MRFLFITFLFLLQFKIVFSQVNFYWQKATTGKIVSPPIIDNGKVAILTQDRWFLTYELSSLKKLSSLRFERTFRPYLVKDFKGAYYLQTKKNDFYKIKDNKTIWRLPLKYGLQVSPTINKRYILLLLSNGEIQARDFNEGELIFSIRNFGDALSPLVVFDDGSFFAGNTYNDLIAYDSWGEIIWKRKLKSSTLRLSLSSSDDLLVSSLSGDILKINVNNGQTINSSSLKNPIHFIFENLKGEFLAISKKGLVFLLDENLKVLKSKKLSGIIKDVILLNSKELFLVFANGLWVHLDENFSPLAKGYDLKDINNITANEGYIVSSANNWILSFFKYKPSKDENLYLWKNQYGNAYLQNRLRPLEYFSQISDKSYTKLLSLANKNYAPRLYDEVLETLDLLLTQYNKLPEEYLVILEKLMEKWLLSKTTQTNRIKQRGEFYKYFTSLNVKSPVKIFIKYAVQENDISNILKIMKNLHLFNYKDDWQLTLNYIKYIIYKYQGNLDLAYSAINNIKNILDTLNKAKIKYSFEPFREVLSFMLRQNFSPNINDLIKNLLFAL